MLYSDHLIEYVILFGLKIKSQNTLTRKWFINLSATSAMVFTLVKLSFIFLLVNINILGNQYLLKRIYVYTEKDVTAIRKHWHNHCHAADTSCF